ncbi:MAG: hypothetical protein Q4E47_03015 [Candidatus Saccharibacteria bacterium]|nr:hypothetical protein [Candidatus Saccharibacteria bacterium]
MKKSFLNSPKVLITAIVASILVILGTFFFLDYLFTPVNAPEIRVTITPKNTAKESIDKWGGGIRYPLVTEQGSDQEILFATNFDEICVYVDKNPGHDSDRNSGFSLKVNGQETGVHHNCWTWKDLRDSKMELRNVKNTYTGWTTKANYAYAGLFSSTVEGDVNFREIEIVASNRAGTITKRLKMNFLDGCQGYSLNYDQENYYTKCDQDAEDNYRALNGKNSAAFEAYKKAHEKPTSSNSNNNTNHSNSGSSSGSGGSTGYKNQKTPNGLSRSTAVSACERRTTREGYNYISETESNMSGNTWKVELEAWHIDYYDTMMVIKCHVSGTDSSPQITYFYADEHADYYFDEDENHYVECWYGYNPATGECR